MEIYADLLDFIIHYIENKALKKQNYNVTVVVVTKQSFVAVFDDTFTFYYHIGLCCIVNYNLKSGGNTKQVINSMLLVVIYYLHGL